MSKDQLTKIKNVRYFFHDDPDSDLYKDWQWLIQQAERAQEYDRELISLEDNKHYVSEILEQNKRYRESIEVAIHNMETSSDNLGVKYALKILEQALEGEE